MPVAIAAQLYSHREGPSRAAKAGGGLAPLHLRKYIEREIGPTIYKVTMGKSVYPRFVRQNIEPQSLVYQLRWIRPRIFIIFLGFSKRKYFTDRKP